MGFDVGGFLGDGLAIGTLGLVGPEDTRARLPLGQMTGARTDDQKNLLETQRRIAQETQRFREEQRAMFANQRAQSIAAFAPRNALMAKAIPSAAFNPQQAANMARDPSLQAPDPKFADPRYDTDPEVQQREQAWLAQNRQNEQNMGNVSAAFGGPGYTPPPPPQARPQPQQQRPAAPPPQQDFAAQAQAQEEERIRRDQLARLYAQSQNSRAYSPPPAAPQYGRR